MRYEVKQFGVTTWADSKQKAVRIHHPTLRNCVYTLTNIDRPYAIPHECSICGQNHSFKTYHLNLNEHGDVCVSEGVYEMFKSSGLVGELRATKEVTPMPMVVSMASINGREVVPAAARYVYNRERGIMEPESRRP